MKQLLVVSFHRGQDGNIIRLGKKPTVMVTMLALPLTMKMSGRELELYSENEPTGIMVNDIVKITDSLPIDSIEVTKNPNTGENFVTIPSKEEKLITTIEQYLEKSQATWESTLVMLLNTTCSAEEALEICTCISNPTFVDKVMESYGL
jgi:hypothetical protein